MTANANLSNLSAYWMPYTGNRQFKNDPRILVAAKGCYYTDQQGRQILDGLAGLWTCGLGHCPPEVVSAIQQQAATLDYAPAFQFGHPGAFELANRISEFMPKGLNRVFFTNSGSDAADTALKMARAYWRAKGQGSKTRFIGREKGYHGVNFGGASVGGIGGNRKLFGQGIEVDHLPHTQLKSNVFSRGLPENGVELADELLNLIALHDASNIAAVIVEPMSGSGGVVVPPKGYLKRLREICTQHNILLIFDEVITAFGRLGTSTGAAFFDVTPDMLTFAKQITNGMQPMGGVVVKQEIYDFFMSADTPDYMVEFPHGYTYSAHPIACAAGNATLSLLKNSDVIARSAALAPHFENAVHSLRGLPHITDIRNLGLAAGIMIAPYPNEPARRPYEIAMRCWEQGVYVRYGGDTIQLAPAFIMTPSEVDRLIETLRTAIKSA